MAGKRGAKPKGLTETPNRYSERPFLDQMDGRFLAARVLKGRVRALEESLGGPEVLSYQQRSLVARFVCLEAWLERQEAGLATGKPVDEGTYMQALNVFGGLLTRLGLARRAKPVETTLAARLHALPPL